jgi:hypothetical protein
MKTIATFWKTEEAHLLRLRLGESGIQGFLQDEHITQLHPWRAAAMGGVRVQVADADFDKATDILSDGGVPAVVQIQSEVGDALACCACQAVIPPDQTRCPACGWSYEGVEAGL